MNVARSIDEVIFDENSIVTVGSFDGVHLGHCSIIEQVTRRAREQKARAVVITFDPHPREVVGRGPVKLLSTLEERLVIISGLGIDTTIVLPFTYKFSRLTSKEFYEQYVIKKIGVREVIEGHDHMFGRDREADIATLDTIGKYYGFNVIKAQPVMDAGEIVSSSKIREALMRGDVDKAEQFLGRPYSLTGVVIKGDRRGEQLGFPTANIQPSADKKLVPAEGVYVVAVEYDLKHYFGMLNIGVRPTFSSMQERVIEVHIFNVTESLYTKQLTIGFLKRLRPETKFSSREQLIDQLHRDKNESINYIRTLS